MTSTFSIALPQEQTKEIAWRIVSIGETEIPMDWEENNFTLQENGDVKGPFTESEEFHWLQGNGVSEQEYDNAKLKVTTTTSDTASQCRHKRIGDRVSVVLSYNWSSKTSFPGGEAIMKMTSQTVLDLPDNVLLDPPTQLTGTIQRLMSYDGTFPGGGSRKTEQNLTGLLELRLKNEEPTPESFEAIQAVKSLPIVIEQVPKGDSE